MVIETVRQRVAELRQPQQSARIATALWIVWAAIVWNVVFDHVIVSAGRAYIIVALRAAAEVPHRYVNMDDWMGPAVPRAFWTATLSASAIAGAGWWLVRAASPHAFRNR